MKYVFQRLKKLFSKNKKETRKYCFPEYTEKIITFFYFADDLHIINHNNESKNLSINWSSDRITLIVDNYIYVITVMDDFIQFQTYNKPIECKKIDIYLILKLLSYNDNKIFFSKPKDDIYNFLNKKFKSKLRKLKIKECL